MVINMYVDRSVAKYVVEALKNHKILFLLGARQVGKTTLIETILKEQTGDLLNMDIDLERARVMEAAHLEPSDAVRVLTQGELLVIDEAHRVPEIGRITKGWYDKRVPVKIILLGSSSATLVDIAAAELVGRNEKLWLTPLLFEEILRQQTWFMPGRPPQALQQAFAAQIQALLLQRLVFGSYPEAYLAADPRTYLENLVSDYLLKDIFTKSLVRSPEDVRRLLLELTLTLGEPISVMQLATRLKLSRQTIQRYLDLLEGIFVIFKLPAYSTDPQREITKQQKYYFWDTGVKNALQREWVVSSARSDIDVLWENWVIAEIMKLRYTYRRHEDLFFWRSRHDSNVELVVKQGSALHQFAVRFDPHAVGHSRSFAQMYGVATKTITPQNILEVLL